MKFDSYTMNARVAPAAVTALIPILVLNHFLVSEELKRLIGDVIGMEVFSGVAMSVLLIMFLAEFARAISKHLFQDLLFEDELRMPTTQYMLFSDPTFSEDFKNRFRVRILKDFQSTLPSAAEEVANEKDARKRISEAITSVRRKLHTNAFLLQHNIEYGAIRNSLGGAALAVCISLVNGLIFYCISPNVLAVLISLILAVVYGLWIALGPWLVGLYGRSYARILFREYMK